MSSILEFKTERDKSVEKVLEEALEEKFSTVYILGVKDDKIFMTHSGCKNMLLELGMLEATKDNLLKNW
jgi:diphthamide biosynthesis methyltransferase